MQSRFLSNYPAACHSFDGVEIVLNSDMHQWFSATGEQSCVISPSSSVKICITINKGRTGPTFVTQRVDYKCLHFSTYQYQYQYQVSLHKFKKIVIYMHLQLVLVLCYLLVFYEYKYNTQLGYRYRYQYWYRYRYQCNTIINLCAVECRGCKWQWSSQYICHCLVIANRIDVEIKP